MGLFFEDKKPPPPPVVIQQVKEDWLAVLFGTIGAIILFTLKGVGLLLGWIFKPLLTYLFTFEGRTREQSISQVVIILILFGLTSYGVMHIPWVRYTVLVSSTHTINYSGDRSRIYFPPDEAFRKTSMRNTFVVDGSNVTYITYAGYTERDGHSYTEAMSSNHCQLVPRLERLGMWSYQPPVKAEGFLEQVTYNIHTNVRDLRGSEYALHIVLHPTYLFKSKDDLGKIELVTNVKTSWEEFIRNWSGIGTDNQGKKSFEVGARWNEHGVICF